MTLHDNSSQTVMQETRETIQKTESFLYQQKNKNAPFSNELWKIVNIELKDLMIHIFHSLI